MADYQQYDDIFTKASEKYGVSKSLLLGVAKTESNFDSKATSSVGAKGIMQLMDDTAKSLGVTNSYDPEQNIMGGAKYLSQLLEKYDGDTDKALASYNGGMGNVAKYGHEKYSSYYNKVYQNMSSLSGEDSTNSSGNFVNLGIKDKAENGIETVVNVVVIVLVIVIGVVFIALSIGSATGTTGKMVKGVKAISKIKKGNIKGAVKEVSEVASDD